MLQNGGRMLENNSYKSSPLGFGCLARILPRRGFWGATSTSHGTRAKRIRGIVAGIAALQIATDFGPLRKGPPFHGSQSSGEMKIQNASCQTGGRDVTGR